MAKKQVKKERYEYIRAIVDCGELRWEYRIAGLPAARMSHDEDASDWSEEDIADCTRTMLDVEQDDPVEIEVSYS